MCLRIKEGCKIEIAKKPIPVYKVVDYTGDRRFLWNKTWKANIRRTRHRYNRCLVACIHLEINEPGKINEGFHAYIKNVCALGLRYAIIPRGAEYCRGVWDEIVANQMIVFSSKKKFDKYINKNK